MMFGGNLGNQIVRAIACTANRQYGRSNKHILAAARLIARAVVARGRLGRDFRSARQYWFVEIGGLTIRCWPSPGCGDSLEESLRAGMPDESGSPYDHAPHLASEVRSLLTVELLSEIVQRQFTK